MTKSKSQSLTDAVMDELMTGPGSITDLALETDYGAKAVKRAILQLESQGLVEKYQKIQNYRGAPIQHYQIARTRKVA